MLTKKDLMFRIIDLERIINEYEEEIYDLQKRVSKLEKPKTKKK